MWRRRVAVGRQVESTQDGFGRKIAHRRVGPRKEDVMKKRSKKPDQTERKDMEEEITKRDQLDPEGKLRRRKKMQKRKKNLEETSKVGLDSELLKEEGRPIEPRQRCLKGRVPG
ncbi:unnamed protein product [Calypogeia fissa]